ncbi:Hint domain-containing protein [Desulfovibrio inopinatus]|uniref:Hint domain-containing protein n=1 Tax=Desulfovibrio inopinatus TaxID=102109 RepID=UPI000A0237A7|nr:Hint domain-containing protein [Desulfovibrio inopinatus]
MATYSTTEYVALNGSSDNGTTLSWTGTKTVEMNDGIIDVDGDMLLDSSVDYWFLSNYTYCGYYITDGSGNNWGIFTQGASYYIPYDRNELSPVDAGAITLGDETPGSTDLKSSELETVVICFLKGTLIDTKNGPTPVESLAIGDELESCFDEGTTKTIKFIHRLAVDKRTGIANVTRINPNPILLRAGSLGENTPNKDLFVSPDHAFLIHNEILVEANAMVNGKTILSSDTGEPIDYYYHIELEDHALVSAHNTLSESYIDNVSRAMFDTYEEYKKLYPDQPIMNELDYPRAKSWRQIPRHIKQQLEERKNALCPEVVKNVA